MNEKTMTLTRMEAPAQLPVRKRVAAYARVSMEKDAMLHSLAAQVSYYSERIQRNPEWEYAGVFADFGLTGTKETRPEFQRMLKECREGKIDLILVKSISRFARNTLALLNTVRELKGLGIGVYFEEQKLDTLSGDGEFMLTILASFAQEESRSVSENCKWRIRKKFEQGIPTGFGMYGYKVRNGSFAIKPEEAAVVRRIFQMYLDGMGSVKIMKLLTEEGVPAPLGGLWNASVVMEMLKNEKYAGDLLLQKFYTNNHVEKKRFHNRGELPQYFVGEDHEPIIDRETFDAVQREIAWRTARRKAAKAKKESPGSGVSCFFGCRAHAIIWIYRKRINPSDRPHLLRYLRKEISIQGYAAEYAVCRAGLDLQHVQLPWQGVLRLEADPRGHSERADYLRSGNGSHGGQRSSYRDASGQSGAVCFSGRSYRRALLGRPFPQRQLE